MRRKTAWKFTQARGLVMGIRDDSSVIYVSLSLFSSPKREFELLLSMQSVVRGAGNVTKLKNYFKSLITQVVKGSVMLMIINEWSY